MQQVVGVVVALSLLAAYRLLRGGRPGDRPLIALSVGMAALGSVHLVFQEPLSGIAAAVAGLLVGIVPPYLAMPAQLARLRGEGRLALWLERAAVLFQPGAVRRLHHRIAHVLHLARRGVIDPNEAMRRLGAAESLAGVQSASPIVEAVFRLHADRSDWHGLVGRVARVGISDEVLAGLPFGALDLLVRACCETGDLETGSRVVDHMAAALAENRPHARSVGESGEFPDACLDRARLTLLAFLGADPSRFLGRGSALRPLFKPSDREMLVQRARAMPLPGNWSPGTGRIESLWNALTVQKRLPTFLTGFQAPAPASAALAVVCAAILVLLMVTGSSMDPTHLLRAGACLGDRIREGETWRLFTAMFLHGGPVHLAVNAAFLIQIGNLAERLMGPWRFLAVYLVAGLVGSVTVVGMGGTLVMVGASGAISGIFGAGAVMVWANRSRLPARWVNRNLTAFGLTFLANLALGLALPMVSLSAHGGGFAAGIVTTALLLPVRRLPVVLRRAGVVLLAMGWILVTVAGIQGVGRTWGLSPAELVPIRVATVRVPGNSDAGTPVQAILLVGHPATWARVSRTELPGAPPGWLGAGGQLYRVDASCGRLLSPTGGGGEAAPVPPGDAEALLAFVRRANEGNLEGLKLASGPPGFVLVERSDPDGGVSVTAHRVFTAGMVHLGYRFEPGSRDRELLPGMLERTRLERCETP